MFSFIRTLHNRRPILWSVIAFIIVVAMAATMSVWWNVLLVQNHRIVRQMTAAAAAAELDPHRANVPLALLMVLGLLCSFVIVAGMLYLFLRLIRTVQLNLAQSQFIAAVTHELRSPVASLQILLETIRDPTTPEPKRAEFEERMSEDLRRLRALVDQVLDTARLENILSAATREEFTVRAVVEACLENFGSRLRSGQAQVAVAEIPPQLTVRANRSLLMTALTNVLDNAVKYSSTNPRIHLRVSEEPKCIAIEISDEGIGIEKKELKRVFRRFFRGTDAVTQSRPGTGLGLYFARLAMRAQGGNITADSAGRHRGTCFRIEVPRA
jgi:signal transduction histidine kinase